MPASVNSPRLETIVAHDELENISRLICFMAFFSGSTLLFVALRTTSRLMQWGRLKGDDILLLAATMQMMAMNILFVVSINKGGLGRHVAAVSVQQLVFFKKGYFAAGITMPTCYATAKLSILWLLHDVFAQSGLGRTLRFLIAVVVFWWLGTIFLDTFLCFPIDARWRPGAKRGCSEKYIQAEYFSTPIPWIVTDFLILTVPLPTLWKTMEASRPKQLALVALFGFGVATCGVAIKRYTTLLQIDAGDLTFSMVEPCIWTMIESSTTIACAALPASTFALRKILPLSTLRTIVEFFETRVSWSTHDTDIRKPVQLRVQTLKSPRQLRIGILPSARSLTSEV